jgi:methionyl-tRNA formyltransferase
MSLVVGIERIVFFGTPAAAVPALEALVEARRAPALVVSRPARPAGRGKKLVEPPLALRARELGLRVVQPAKVRDQGFLAHLEGIAPDLAVVVAFGQIFPRELLELPRLGCVNVHFSLLPRWRGAAPVAAAIAAGDEETGVSIQRMEEGLDTGPVYAARRTLIGAAETAGELTARLATMGAALLVEVVAALERGDAFALPQRDADATYAPKLGGARPLDLALPAAELARQARAFDPEPGVFVELRGERIKVLRATGGDREKGDSGTVARVGREALTLVAGDRCGLDLVRVQRPGGKRISGRDLANGLRLAAGDRVA